MIRIKRRTSFGLPLISCCLSLGIILSVSTPTKAETLQEALVTAYQSNPQLQAARAELRATDEGLAQASGLKRPSVSINADSTYQKSNYSKTNPDKSGREDRMSLNLVQSLFDSGKKEASLQVAEAAIKAGRESLQSQEQTVFLDVASSYMNVVRDQAVLILRKNNVERLTRQLEAANDRFEVGEVTRTDVAQAASRLAQANADEIAATGQLEISKAAYEKAVGKKADTLPIEISDIKVDITIPPSREEAIMLATKGNPDLKVQFYVYDQSRFEVDNQESDLMPKISMEASTYRYNDVAGRGNDTTGYSIGANLTIPLYQGGVAESQTRAARSSSVKALHNLNMAQRTVIESATSAWENYISKQAFIKATEEVVAANRLTLDGIEQEAMVGARTVLDVLDSEQDVMDSEVTLVRAKSDYMLAKFQLASALGDFTVAGLQLSVERYDPDVHYDATKDRWFGWGSDEEPDYVPASAVIAK